MKSPNEIRRLIGRQDWLTDWLVSEYLCRPYGPRVEA